MDCSNTICVDPFLCASQPLHQITDPLNVASDRLRDLVDHLGDTQLRTEGIIITGKEVNSAELVDLGDRLAVSGKLTPLKLINVQSLKLPISFLITWLTYLHCPKLAELVVSGEGKLTARQLERLSATCPRLRRAHLSWNTEGISEISGRLLALSATSAIWEIDKLHHILDYVTEQSLLIFDLDDTLIEPLEDLIDTPAGRALYKRYDGQGRRVAADDYLDWASFSGEQRSVESNSPRLLKELQERGIRIIGLTHRPSLLAWLTVKQLEDAEFDLYSTAPTSSDFRCAVSQSHAVFSQGIVYCDHASKGHVLEEWLSYIEFDPQHIVFVDNLRDNIDEVRIVTDKLNICCDAFHYVGSRKAKLNS